MNGINENKFEAADALKNVFAYGVDSIQRSILYLDVLRQRGNNYFDHIKNGKPPVLTYDYDVVMDGRDRERPVNYSLVRIRDRRENNSATGNSPKRRKNPVEENPYDPQKRPIIISDPRAGHGPGIGGSKRDSEIGMALNEGHPVYFILFDADPLPGQTLIDVHNAQIEFIEEVGRRHPEAQKPAIIANCQAGWASAVLAADRPDKVGPIVLNGSPLSFWAGVDGKNPMRYRGGLVGGAWVNSFWSDLGNGVFDGAHLVNNFEDLNPANTLWDKQYYVYANVDTEAQRYLEFERWWKGFYMYNREEIHYIIKNLFVENRLEKGQLSLHPNKVVDLNDLQAPVLVFASNGDNITPPQQALNWIVNVWGSVAEIKRQKKVIVYLLHETIGHLGIFVSAAVSKKEHKEIVASIDLIEYLSPGLYEMVIDNTSEKGNHTVRFEERDMKDIMALDDGTEDEADFQSVEAVSEINDSMYRTFISPWVKLATSEWTAELIRQLHPLRFDTYIYSDRNPLMAPVKPLAELVRKNRQQVKPDNPFVAMEKNISHMISESLNIYRDMRDQTHEMMFKLLYGNPLMTSLFGDRGQPEELQENVCQPQWLENPAEGGFVEAVTRIMVAMAHADDSVRRRVLKAYRDTVAADTRMKRLSEAEFKTQVQRQACILGADWEGALNALSAMIPDVKDRRNALDTAKKIALADAEINPSEQQLLDQIESVLVH